MTVTFVEQLPGDHRRSDGRKTAAWRQPLRENPGKWAALPIKQKPSRINEVRGFEFCHRQGVLYGRFVGESPNQEPPS